MSMIFDTTVINAKAVDLKFDKLDHAVLHNGTLAHFWTKYADEKRVLHYGYTSIFAEIERAGNGGLLEEELEEYVEEEIAEYDKTFGEEPVPYHEEEEEAEEEEEVVKEDYSFFENDWLDKQV
jgi:hypothetical protein